MELGSFEISALLTSPNTSFSPFLVRQNFLFFSAHATASNDPQKEAEIH
jgi:hypothetical protein